MAQHLEVLITESHSGASEAAAAELERAGHTVHRCFEPGQRGFPCIALTGGACPLDGHIDVAYLKRVTASVDPTPLEDGVRCAIRKGVPVVAELASETEPLDSFLHGRITPGTDVVEACREAAVHRYDLMRQTIHTALEPTLVVSGRSSEDLFCHVETGDQRLLIVLTLAGEPDRRLEHRLAVRALSALDSVDHPFDVVDVSVRNLRSALS